MIFGNSVGREQKKKNMRKIRNLEEKYNKLLSVNILMLNPRSGQYLLSVFGGNVPCHRNTPEMAF